MKTLLRAIAVVSLLLPFVHAKAQQFSISAGSINTCSGVIEDTGGPTGTYGNNENFTLVVCPDTPGDAISLNWIIFDLSQQLPQPIDRMRIWDGNSTAADFLGEYTGTQLQGLISSATIYNTSGCLTLQFTSNGGGVGNFAAGITCYTPCERPTAVAIMSEPTTPAMVCVGEEITFDGTGSYPAAGFNIVEYNWSFADGTTVNSPTATHSFSTPGQYMVQLNLVDDNGCVNSNMVDLEVLVSTTPNFSGTVESMETCLGAIVDLHGVVQPTTWTGMPEANFGDGVYLPDDLGIPFTSDLVFTQFEPGQSVNTTDDILSICTNMEHSFLGDLAVQVTCPNGQTMVIHQQGGGGTYIGGANDTDNGNNPVPGECWQYCWSASATWGTWAESASSGTTPHVMPGGNPSSNALIPGTYSPVQPFTNLIGCPLNGTWTFTVTDLWGADNGFLCDWSINFDPALIPDTAQFTPVLGSSIDSLGWSGPFLTSDPGDPTEAQATPNVAGSFDYTFHVTDNFGCTYDTTITVTVAPQMEVDAGPALTLCNDSLPMAGAITANGPPNTCNWTVTLYDNWGDGWNGNGSITVTVDGVGTNYYLPTGMQQTVPLTVSSGASISVAFNPGSWNDENSFTLFNDLGVAVYTSPNNPPAGMNWSGTVQCGGAPPVTYAWLPTSGLADPSDATSMVWVTSPTWYFLSVHPTGSPDCAVLDSVLVSPPPQLDPGEDGTAVVCVSSPTFLMTDSLGGTPDPGGSWAANGGAVPDNFAPSNYAPGSYSFTYTVTTPGGCMATSQLEVTVKPDTDPTCCGVPDAGPADVSCDLTIGLHATPGNTGVGEWSGPPGAVFTNNQSPITTVTMPSGSGGSHWFYWRENDGVYCNTVDSVLMTFTDPIVPTFTVTDAICFTYCDGTASATVSGGNAGNGFTYAWSAGTPGTGPDNVEGLCAGDHQLTITDDNGCTGTGSFTIMEPVQLQIDSTATVPVTCSGYCDGQVLIFDGEAVEFSFNNGAAWGSSPVLEGVCEGVYQLLIRDAAGCLANSSVTVTGPPPVIADFVWGPKPSTVEDPTIFFQSTGTGAQTYLWDIAGLATSSNADTVFTFTNEVPGIYRVCLSAFNYNQCIDSVCQFVEIMDVLEPYVPNAFTPDGNGVNDVFFMSTNVRTITDFEMLIYDRWGQLVFSTTDPYQPWIGSRNNSGEVLSSGVYVYRIRYAVKNLQTKREFLGHVTLLK
ncbi:MAG: gliding motility-associated C-terminal domain-containing protein [Flavobacteriales bacterium]|nr:gliding motility-associated C-terminal domain-containing protein [Flavobacteriales bacterium]